MENSRLKKSLLCSSIVMALGLSAQLVSAGDLGANNNNFTMLSPGGDPVGGTNVIKVTWDGSLNNDVASAVTNMTISSPTPFFGGLWVAHDVQVFGPGTHTFEACPAPIDTVTKIAADGSIGCAKSKPQTMVVAKGQVGVHMLFDWNGSNNIDVVNVWDVDAVWGFGPLTGVKSNLQSAETGCVLDGGFADPTTPECQALLQTKWMFTATDPDGNAVPGTGMVDGPFKKFNAAFNIRKVAAFDDAIFAAENTSSDAVIVIDNDQLPATTGAYTVTGFDATTAQGGSVTDNGDNTLTYLPPVNFKGIDSFTYTVGDGVDHTVSASFPGAGLAGHYTATAKVGVVVLNETAALSVSKNTTSATSSAEGSDGESGGVGALGVLALPLMLLLLPLRLFFR